ECARALSNIPGRISLDGLAHGVSDPSTRVVRTSCQAFIDRRSKRAAGLLAPLIHHTDWNVAFQACYGLIRLGALTPQLLEALESLASRPEASRYDQD